MAVKALWGGSLFNFSMRNKGKYVDGDADS